MIRIIKNNLTLTAFLLILAFTLVESVSYGNCTAGTLYHCPSKECGGGFVKDCFDCEGFLSSDEEHKICFDRRLFQKHNVDPDDYADHYHFLVEDLIGAFVWFFTAGISIACGVGGGGIYVPLGILLFKFAPKQASGFSQAGIFGAGLAGLILNSQNCHPTEKIRHDPGVSCEGNRLPRQKELTQEQEEEYVNAGGQFYTRPLVNYDMALFMSPAQMSGAVLGVIIQKLLPNWLYLLFAGVVLAYTAYKTYVKYISARKTEITKRKQVEKASEGHSAEDSTSPQADGDNDTENKGEEQTKSRQEAAPSSEAAEWRIQYLKEDMIQYPKEKIGALIALWIGLFFLTLMKGGKGVDSLVGIDCESLWYAVFIVCQFLWLLGFALFFGRKLMNDQKARLKVSYPFLEEDPIWQPDSMRIYGGMCFLSGLVAALIGIGGGMILGPLMLVLGINPRVSTATNATMIVVTSSSIAVMFVTSGLVHYSYALFYFCVCFCGAWVGKSKIDAYVKRTNKASALIFILASIILFATVGCFVIFFTRLSDNDWCFEDFNSFCSISGDGEEEDCPVNRFLSAF